MKFLCDQMLGTLAKWLRIFGFDTYYANAEIEDKKLLEIAKKEKRILITRDKQLLRTARKENISVIELNTTDIEDQLRHILRNVDIDEDAVLSRCSLCNTVLEEIQKNEVEGKVPERIFENNEKFWFCSVCNKIYWMGSHGEKILKRINEIKKIQK